MIAAKVGLHSRLYSQSIVHWATCHILWHWYNSLRDYYDIRCINEFIK